MFGLIAGFAINDNGDAVKPELKMPKVTIKIQF